MDSLTSAPASSSALSSALSSASSSASLSASGWSDGRPFAPVAMDQRIEALDVVRGFALIGIFLMNIEWFNRPFATFDEGMPLGLTGADWLASWFIAYFVQGKFWTIFSLLFGMGFAVMLVRAERAGRDFTRIYLRRILALAVFGAAHYIFLWHGDILFSYSVAALALLIVLYGRARPILIGCAVLIGLGLIPGADLFFRVASGLATYGLLALYLRGTRQVTWRGVSMPVFCVILLAAGAITTLVAVVLWALPDGPIEPRAPTTVLGPLLLVYGWLAWRYHEPVAKRSVRMAVALYLFAGITSTGIGLVQQLMPDPEAAAAPATSIPATSAPATSAPPTAAPAVASSGAGSAAAKASAAPAAASPDKATKTREQRATEHRADREKQLAENATDKAEEIEIYTRGTYLEAVALRSRAFTEKAANDAGFAVLLLSMFLLGMWFVRSGVMEDPGKHLALFRKLALYGLPLGIGLGLLSALIATSHVPGERYDGWGVTRGLRLLGNLPACLGYVGLVVTMLYSRTVFSNVRVLGPVGRMALTNYLMQSVICMFFFFGFGLGHWGMSRAHQVLFVAVVFSGQVVFSHWWLARFRYGPMEWLWRGFTYRQVPAMRLAEAGGDRPGQPV